MKKIKIDDWKPFEIEKLFTVKRPKSRSVKKYNEGEIPFVSSGNYNNGVDSYREPIDDEDLDKGNCITVSPVDGSTFYQPKDFLGRGGGGSSIMLLYNDNLNKFNGLFIASVIRESLKIKYQYNDMGSSDSIKKENILLPALDDETPDWNFMEEAMKRLETRERESTSNLTSYLNNAKLNKVDTSKWKEFIVGDLFENIASHKSRQNIEGLLDLVPDVANKVNPDGSTTEIDLDDVEVGDILLVRDGEKIGVDGVVIEGHGLLDTSSVTGESMPVEAEVGSEIIS
ncbi:MAG: restriction endonuclease subunit S, partial [Anaerococcus vaginalis]|nr:restriction endonuclease subunit S [Anaerococcus vaginalis]